MNNKRGTEEDLDDYIDEQLRGQQGEDNDDDNDDNIVLMNNNDKRDTKR